MKNVLYYKVGKFAKGYKTKKNETSHGKKY